MSEFGCVLGFRQIDNYDESALPIQKAESKRRKGKKNVKRNTKGEIAPKGAKVRIKTSSTAALKKKKRKTKNKGSVPSSIFSYQGTVEPVELDEQDLSAWREFELPLPILQSLKAYNFVAPTEIQAKVIGPAIRTAKNVAIAAETGSGKTLCYGIPIVTAMLTRYTDESYLGKLQAVIIAPTRELALQVKDHLLKLCVFTKIRIVAVFGGISEVKQIRLLKRRPEIIVATPGRLWNLYNMGLEHLIDEDAGLSSVKFVVMDEADRLFERAHFAELEHLLGVINGRRDVKRQCFVLSATLNTSSDVGFSTQNVSKLAGKLSMDAGKMLVFDLTNPKKTVKNLTEKRIMCSFEDKDVYLYYLITSKRAGRTLVFANSITSIKRLASLLRQFDLRPFTLHAKMHQNQRLRSLEVYSGTSSAVLLATDVAARGLDIPQVDLVIHYQLPRSVELYVHRSGRTARGANVSGDTVLLVCPEEAKLYANLVVQLNKGQDIRDYRVDISHLDRVRRFVFVTRQIEKLQHLLNRETTNYKWFERMADECDLDVDDWLQNKQEYRKDTSGRYREQLERLEQLRADISEQLKKSLATDRVIKRLHNVE